MIEKNRYHDMDYIAIVPEQCEGCLWWLHGYKEPIEHILENSIFEQCSEKYHVAIVIPNLPSDTYYTKHSKHYSVEEHLIMTLMPVIWNTYHMPAEREKNYIGGASMGGFGSLLIGSNFSQVFGKIVSVSGAFIIDDILINNPEVTYNQIEHFVNLFGDIPSLEYSVERNPLCAAEKTLQQGILSPIFLTCGREDMLYKRNVRIKNKLQALGADVTWLDTEWGAHNWEFTNSVLDEVFLWLKNKTKKTS